jgi:hypothetical protein
VKFFTKSLTPVFSPIHAALLVKARFATNFRKGTPESNFRQLLHPLFLTVPQRTTILSNEEKNGILL